MENSNKGLHLSMGGSRLGFKRGGGLNEKKNIIQVAAKQHSVDVGE